MQGEQNRSAQEGRLRRRRQLRQALDAIYLAQLGTITLVIAGYYLVAVISHLIFLDDTIRLPVTTAAALAFLVSSATHILLRKRMVPQRLSHVAFLPSGLGALFVVFLHVALSGDVLQLTNAVLGVMAFAFITLMPWAYGLLIAVTVVLFVACLYFIGGQYVVHVVFMGFTGLTLSILCFIQRYRTLMNVERLLISNREKSQALSFKAQEARSLWKEAEQAAAEARRASEAKGVFLANTSHELRTPLTGVLGMMKLLEQSDLTKDQHELLSTAQFSAQTLLTLINDILDLARMDEGKLELKAEPFRAGEIAFRIVELMRPMAAEKGLDLVFHAPTSACPAAMGDSVRIGQVLFNLLGNAIKFTDAGRVEVTVEATKNTDGACQLAYIVRDTGPGFDPAEVERLFHRFEQADGSAVKRQGGAGLGLAISAELSALMGGDLSAESEPGKGATFTFRLALPPAPKVEPGDDLAPGGNEGLARPVEVLVAEDNKVNQMLLNRLAATLPWKLTIVGDGEAAERAALAHDFDIVLMDVRMPVKDGTDATMAIRAAKGPRGRVPIIALTANTMADDIERYRRAGMDAVVSKPIDMAELKKTVAQLLGREEPMQQS